MTEKELLALLNVNPGMDTPLLAERLGVSVSMVYYLTADMKKKGILEKDRRKRIWNIVNQV